MEYLAPSYRTNRGCNASLVSAFRHVIGVVASSGDSKDTLRTGTARGDGDDDDEGGGGSVNRRAGK